MLTSTGPYMYAHAWGNKIAERSDKNCQKLILIETKKDKESSSYISPFLLHHKKLATNHRVPNMFTSLRVMNYKAV